MPRPLAAPPSYRPILSLPLRVPGHLLLCLLLLLLLAAPGPTGGRAVPGRSRSPGDGFGAASRAAEIAAPPTGGWADYGIHPESVVASRRFPTTVLLEAPNPCGLRRFPLVRRFVEKRAAS